jgi:hypothetical protein
MGGEVPGKNTDKWKKHTPPLPLVRDEEVIETLRPKDQDKLTALYTDTAVKFVKQNKNHPFFLYLPHTAVHIPLHPGEKFRGKSQNGLYGDWVEEIDWCVGKVMEAVREEGLQDRTLIVFSSDNGPWLAKGTNAGNAGPLRSGKGSTFEGGMREPTIFWWPGKIAANTSCDAAAANFDLLPTFVKLAGGSVPNDRKIDGKDISPLFLGATNDSPHEALYYFSSKALQAVRVGPWKLAIVPQYEGHGGFRSVAPDLKKPLQLRLYNLDEDIGEKNDVAKAHPEIAQRLESYIREMDGDLGAGDYNGPGVREPGRVGQPVGLWLPGHQPSPVTMYQPSDSLHLGDELAMDEAPQIAGKTLRITCRVKPKSTNAVIVAQGGKRGGYSLYLTNGSPVFAVREGNKLFTVAADSKPTKSYNIDAQLLSDGTMKLAIDKQPAVTAKAGGLIKRQPTESLCVGFDDGAPVADYGFKPNDPFQGGLSGLKIITAEPSERP